MFTFFHQLPLSVMFLVALVISLAVCWAIIFIVRAVVPRLGFTLTEPLPIKDSIINACGALFALIVAFSAAGIWNDAVTARNAVQREADAIENALVLAISLPAEPQTAVRDNLRAYVGSVLKVDWPAMRLGMPLEDAVFDISEKNLVNAIDVLSRQQVSLGSLATFTPLLNQLLEVRHARLARLAASNAGVTWAQWIAMILISTSALGAVVLCNSHSFPMQIAASHLYVLVVAAAYFVILSHDRPFIGVISVQPSAMVSILDR